MKRFFVALFLFVLALSSFGGATTLTGTVKNPDGSAFNGVIFFTLSQAATVSSAGTCGGPIYVPNTFRVPVQVVGGSIVSSPNLYDSNCFNVQGAIPYGVQMISSTGQIVAQTWVVTSSPLQTGSVNVGTIVPINQSGQTFYIPQFNGIQVDHVFTAAGTFNFDHGLNDEYPLYNCFSLSGATATTPVPVDVNNMAVTVSAAAHILCTFQPTAQLSTATPNFSFALTPSSQSYTISGSGTQTPTYAISQAATGGYGNTVTYSVTGLPGGITPTCSPSTITASGACTLTLSFPATQATGTDTFTVSATDGTLTHTMPGSITINASSTPDFSFTITPATFTYTPTMGGTQTPTFAIAQTAIGSYSGTATYSTSGLASGMSYSFSPATITGTGSSTLSVSFPATQAAGTTTITTSATDGTHTHTNPLSLTISDINQNLLDGWQMRDGSGTTFADATANANTQTFSGSIGTWGAVTGFPGVPFTFNGTGLSNGSNSTLTNFDGSTSFTITWWAKITSAAGTNRFMGNYDPGTNGILLQINGSGGISSVLKGTTGATMSGVWTSQNILGSLHFFAFVYTGPITAATQSLYIDGVLQSTVSNSSSGTLATGIPWQLGGNATSYIAGTFADVAIYSGAKTGAQIAAYYAAGIR